MYWSSIKGVLKTQGYKFMSKQQQIITAKIQALHFNYALNEILLLNVYVSIFNI